MTAGTAKVALRSLALQYAEHRVEPLAHSEQGRRRPQIRRANARGPGCDTEVDRDADAAASAAGPADFVIGEAFFVRNRVALFPRHSNSLRLAEIVRGTSGRFARSS